MTSTRTSRRTLIVACALATALALWSAPGATAVTPNDPGAFGRSHRQVCGAVPARFARCHSEIVTDAAGDPVASVTPAGYGPAQLQSAYNLTSLSSSAGGTQTIGIVDAYDDPNAESDLGVYRSQFGLPACTTANGCFRKVDQNGGTNYPTANSGWAQEISLDLDMASAICPNCKILLVEANSALLSDLGTAVNRAALLGATQIANAYGGDEFKGETLYEGYYNHPGVAVTVSSGDSGYRAEFPASSRYVTAVGGTTLQPAGNARGWSETVWSGTGSGCSAYIAKPSWQTDSGCTKRTLDDVATVADPNTGVAVYDTYKAGGWLEFGGTSVGAGVVAGFDALLGSAAGSPQYPYDHQSSYYDVTSGSNGKCGGSYLCTGVTGYDGPTGWGTPNGVPSGSGGTGGSGGGGTGGGGTGGGGTSPPPSGTTTTNPIALPPITTSPSPVVIDTTRPAFLSLSLSPTTFHAARSGPAVRSAIATGTRVSFSLSEAATVRIRVERAASGRRVGGRCVPVTARNRSAPRCTRYVLLAGQLSRAGRAGANAFRFMGRWGGRALRPNRYRLVLTATDPAGNRSLARRIGFRIV